MSPSEIRVLSNAQARRTALAAQGFGRPRPTPLASQPGTANPLSAIPLAANPLSANPLATANQPGIRQLDAAIHRIGLLQLDSVNVFERSHYLPMFARLGAYDKADLDRLTFGKNARYTEYWAHVAAIIPLETWPLWRFRMHEERVRYAKAGSWPAANREMMDWLLAELAEKGPLPASKIEHDANKGRGGWWEWSDVKSGLEYLFAFGDVVSAGRTRFERTYGLPEQVLPAELLNQDVSKHEAARTLLTSAALSHGVGTASDLGDYYRFKRTYAAGVLDELVADGTLLPAHVTGWERGGKPVRAYLHPEARIPRRIEATAFLSPFDPVVWERQRALRMFDFHYRIEIYTPAPKRIYGYYSLPILIDDHIVGRIDLKNDRQNRVLRVQSAWREAHASTGFEPRVAALLHDTARWQGLEAIEVMDRGDLPAAIAAELGQSVISVS